MGWGVGRCGDQCHELQICLSASVRLAGVQAKALARKLMTGSFFFTRITFYLCFHLSVRKFVKNRHSIICGLFQSIAIWIVQKVSVCALALLGFYGNSSDQGHQ